MLSDYYNFYKGTAAYSDATAMPVILENGRKVFGPPHKYNGPAPTHVCELYVTRIPPQLEELGFLVWLHRIGQVYTFRLMMDTGNTTRGYAFVRFCNESDALAAFELIKYFYVNGERLGVFRSQGKNRLFVSGIPRQLPLSCLDDGFKLVFPSMQSCTAYPAIRNNFFSGRENEENRGFAFIEFENHEKALAAKKRLNTGRIRMWGVDLKIQWAKPKEEMQVAIGSKKYEDPLNTRLHPQLHKPNDYCAKLRLYCLANNFCIPVLLYGSSSRFHQLQYAGILIKNSFTGIYCYFLVEILVDKISDIHLLVCEIAVKMIEENNGQLLYNALVRVFSDSRAEIVYIFKHCDELKCLRTENQIKNLNAITELAASLQALGLQNHEKLLLLYKRSFLTHQPVATFNLDVNNPLTQYCAVLPKYRNNRKLNNNFNDFEITLLLKTATLPQQSKEKQLAHFMTLNTFEDNRMTIESQKQQQQTNIMRRSQYFTLKSQNANFGIKYTLRYVDMTGVEQRECYHPEQRVNSNPIWISGHSYQQWLYN